jgi:thiol-disulfide isomerase/thioredoxin
VKRWLLRRRLTVLGGIVIVVTLAGSTLLLWPAPGAAGPSVPRALSFQLISVRQDGSPPVTLAAVPGHPVIVNFFASWCDPCHEELPLLADMQRRMNGRVEVLGVDVQDNRPLATQMLDEAKVGFAAGYDPSRSVSDAWGIDGLPVTAFIGADGTVVDLHRGQLRQGDLDRLVQHLLVTGASARHRQSS